MGKPEFINIQSWLKQYDPSSTTPIAERMFGPSQFMVSWFINSKCNFSCEYCGHYTTEHESVGNYSNVKIAKSFDAFGDCGHIIITGGEPFLFPEFIELCQLLTNRHYLSLNTNLSTSDIDRFASCINPERVIMINAGLHSRYRAKTPNGMNAFIRNYNLLYNRGFNIVASHVVYPDMVENLENDIEYYHSLGIKKVSAKSFCGMYEGKLYPKAYSPVEREKVEKYMRAQIDMPEYLNFTKFTGRKCLCGCNFFSIDPGGNVTRCNSDGSGFGNIFEATFMPSPGATDCVVEECLCPYQGMIYSSH